MREPIIFADNVRSYSSIYWGRSALQARSAPDSQHPHKGRPAHAPINSAVGALRKRDA